MKNKIYGDELFNEDRKKEYLSRYKVNTRKTILRIFKASYSTEKDLNKDLCDFNREQIRTFIFFLNPSKIRAAQQIVSAINQYINWSIDHGYSKVQFNPLNSITPEWYEQFVKNKIQYLTDQDIEKIINRRVNAQDKVVISLLFEGVSGVGFSEILNLRREDVDDNNNTLFLRSDNGTQRMVYVSSQCITHCIDAYEEKMYIKMDGKADPDVKSDSIQLADNNYIVRVSLTNASNDRADKFIVYRRIKNISKFENLPYLTAANIQYSGMLAMAKNMYLASGKLSDAEYDMIGQRFNIPKLPKTDKFDILALKKEFLNVNKIKELYDF